MKKKIKFKTQFDPDYKGSSGTVNNHDSCTIPDDCLSLRQLMQNHTRNVASATGYKEGYYSGDTEIPIFNDITEMMEYRKDLEAQAKELEKQIKEEQKEKQIKKEEDEKRQKEEQKTKEKETSTTNPATSESGDSINTK